jgi:hypothetical protein
MKPKIDADLAHYQSYIEWHQNFSNHMYEVEAWSDVDNIVEGCKRCVDQGSTESINDVPEDQWHGIPWIIVNGVTRRYGYTE